MPVNTAQKTRPATPRIPTITIHQIVGVATPKTEKAVNKILSGGAVFAGVPV